MCKTKNVVAFGTLREDLLLQYDFTTPIGGDEIKIGDYKSVVGGRIPGAQWLASLTGKLQTSKGVSNTNGRHRLSNGSSG